MRWHVHGKDAETSKALILVVEDATAAGAAQVAMAKHVVVTKVRRGSKSRLLLMGLAMSLSGTILVGGFAATLYWREQDARSQLQAALAEEERLAADLTESGGTIAALQRRTLALEIAQGGAAKELVDQLEAARARMQSIDQQLATARAHVADLEKRAAATASLKRELGTAQSRVAELGGQLQTQRQRVQELEKSKVTTAQLERANQELAAQVDLLKTQLLEQVAKTSVPVVQVVEPAPPVMRPHRWGLRTSYDAAVDFLALNFAKDGTSAVPAGEGTVATTGVSAGSAATLRLVHDLEKKSVYNSTLTLSLSVDAPKEKLLQNHRLLADFLRQFAGGFKEPDTWVAEALRQLGSKDASEKIVRSGEDYKLTVWNNRLGLYSWKIESPRVDLDD